MRVFLDTNVLVSAFVARGLSADVVRVVMAEHELVTSEVILEELRRVLADKIRVPRSTIDAAIGLLRRHQVVPTPGTPYSLGISDPDDEWVVAAVVASGADVFVTGDRELLEACDLVEDIRFLSPRAFWELLAKRRSED